MIFSTKARNLKNLTGILRTAKILPLLIYKKSEILANLQKIEAEILEHFSQNLIIRSSSNKEDSNTSSHAGEFDSLQNVKKENLKDAILKVSQKLSSEDEILIQPMLENIDFFAVVMSSVMDANYASINYDESGNSKNLTNGDGLFKTQIILKTHKPKEIKFAKILELLHELENIYNTEFIDIEVAFSKNELYLFQIRPIANKTPKTQTNLTQIHGFIEKKFEKLTLPRPNLLGKRTIFGIMPDWNPAEILGLRPKRLAISLYKELITDNIWAYGRDNYGYKNLRSFPLMFDFAGLCYIDTRVSFNSFLPKSINDTLGEKLVNFWLDKLEKNPKFHDKVEFEIILSAYEFDIDEKLKQLNKFSKKEKEQIKSSLKEITINAMSKNGRFYKDLARIDELEIRYNALKNANLASIDKIYWLIEECKRYGTLSFAGIARVAFIATSLLNSLVRINAISIREKDEFLNSLNTISSRLSSDFARLNKDEFLEIYGHLRLNTYDITSPRYDENYDEYFSDIKPKVTQKNKFKPKNAAKIQNILKEHGFSISVDELFKFIAKSIEARESSKFIFTKALSLALNEIKTYMKRLEISLEDAAFIDIKVLLGFYTTLESLSAKEICLENIAKNKAEFEITKKLNLPPLICKKDDIYSFSLNINEPNFITQKCIKAQTATIKDKDINGKIICISSADPGYDFIFSKGVVGLITAYGGANSHMAVRCAEFGLPAAIGVGEEKFYMYKMQKTLTIDALNKRIF